MHEQVPGTPRLQSGFQGVGLNPPSQPGGRCFPSVSENSQVRPHHASMHPTVSTSSPSAAGSLQPARPTGSQGSRGTCQGDHGATGGWGCCSHLGAPCSHSGGPLPALPSGAPESSAARFHLGHSRRHPELGRENPSVLKSSCFQQALVACWPPL